MRKLKTLSCGSALAGLVVACSPVSAQSDSPAEAEWVEPAALKPCTEYVEGADPKARLAECSRLLGSARYSGTDAAVLRYHVLALSSDEMSTEEFIDAMSLLDVDDLPLAYRVSFGSWVGGLCGDLQRWECAVDNLQIPFFAGRMTIEQFQPLAHALIERSGQESALSMADKIVEDDAEWNPAYILRAYVRNEGGDGAGAADDLAHAALTVPAAASITHNSICWDLVTEFHQAAKAGPACNAAVASAPDDGNAWDSRAAMNLAIGQYDAALRDYDRALKFQETPIAETLYGRGLAYEKLGKTAEADADKKAAIALDNDVVQRFAEYRLGGGQ